MLAVVLDRLGPIEERPLSLREVEVPEPGPGELLVKVTACGVCRSNLHMIEGDWAPAWPPSLPVIPGHEVVGTVASIGERVTSARIGDRVGVQPLFWTCHRCEYCVTGREQLCGAKVVTGETTNGGYAEYMLAMADHTFTVPPNVRDADAAPLFCPGITAYGAVIKAHLRPGMRVAVFGVGGVGHMVLQIAGLCGVDVVAVTRGRSHLAVAEELGATPVDGNRSPGAVLAKQGGVDASIVFAPSSEVVAEAVTATKRGGIVVVGAHAAIGSVPFDEEKTVVGSVLGNRQQMREVLLLAGAGKIKAQCEEFPLRDAERALKQLRDGMVRARAVLVP